GEVEVKTRPTSWQGPSDSWLRARNVSVKTEAPMFSVIRIRSWKAGTAGSVRDLNREAEFRRRETDVLRTFACFAGFRRRSMRILGVVAFLLLTLGCSAVE